jgi:SPRY domain
MLQKTNKIVIGISTSLDVSEAGNHPGGKADEGVGYAASGKKWYKSGGTPFGPTFKTGDVIGTLLNMNLKTITFYKNGIRLGTAAGRDHLTDDVYYPCICLAGPGDKIISCDPSTPL